jgi:hypothetical protein
LVAIAFRRHRAKRSRESLAIFNLICSQVSIALSLLQLAETLFELSKADSDSARIRAERAYEKAGPYMELLPDNERVSASFIVGRLRTALDEFRSW